MDKMKKYKIEKHYKVFIKKEMEVMAIVKFKVTFDPYFLQVYTQGRC